MSFFELILLSVSLAMADGIKVEGVHEEAGLSMTVR